MVLLLRQAAGLVVWQGLLRHLVYYGSSIYIQLL
jgi:hypothetical protein